MAHTAVIDIIKQLQDQLINRYPDTALQNQTAWWMLEAVTKKNKAQLIAQDTIELTEQQQRALKNWIHQQVNQHIPLQYVLGYVPFGDLEILVEPPILIPRPETEEWCADIIDQLKQLKQNSNNPLTILDLCSGSGCIGLAIAHAFPQVHVYAADISPHAIALGTKNAEHNNITNITFITSDLFTQLPKNVLFDLIVTNPPYIPSDQWQELDLSVTKWEDPNALIADDFGLKIIKQIINQAKKQIQPNAQFLQHNIPQFVIEIDYPQAEIVIELLKHAGFVDVKSKKDLEGKERIIMGSINNVANPEDSR